MADTFVPFQTELTALTDADLGCRDARTFVVDSRPDIALQQVEIVLAGATALAGKIYGPESFGAPTRVEMRRDPDDHNTQGMYVFCPRVPDGQPLLLLEVRNATLGYEGSGPSLSRELLGFLGVSPEKIQEINAGVWGEISYVVVVEIKRHVAINGANVPLWDWRRLR